MRNLIVILFILLYCVNAQSQEVGKLKELGAIFNTENIGVTYKFGDEKNLWRINVFSILGTFNRADTNIAISEGMRDTRNLNLGLRLGREFRDKVSEKLAIRYGVDFLATYSNTKVSSTVDLPSIGEATVTQESTSFDLGLNGVIGFCFLISENIVFGFELLPELYYSKTMNDNFNASAGNVKTEVSGFNYGLSRSSILLSLACRF